MTLGTVYCGICGERIKPTKLEIPRFVTPLDAERDWKRKYVFNCCGKTWLMRQHSDGEVSPADYGPEIK